MQNPSCKPCPPDPDARPLQASLDDKPQASIHLQRKMRLKRDMMVLNGSEVYVRHREGSRYFTPASLS